MSGVTSSAMVCSSESSMFDSSRGSIGSGVLQEHSAYGQLTRDDDSEDLIVDLSTGSFIPMNLQSWTLMMEVTDKLGKL